jgi:putative MATE family efflux protein
VSGFWQRLRRVGQRPDPDGPNPILTGPVASTLLGLSVPMILAMFLVTSFGLVDMLYLGRFSQEAMAAVSIAFPVTYLILTLAGALGTAATSLCSRLIGRGEQRQVRNLLLHVLLVDGALSALFMPAGLLLLHPVISQMGASPEVTADAVRYGQIIFLGTFFAMLPMSINSLFRAEGDTIFPFKIMAVSLGLNIVLNPVFIFGLGPVPRLGVQGAALTTVMGYALASFLVLRELRNKQRMVHFDRRAWRFNPELLRDLGRVAGPALVATGSTPVGAYIINSLISSHGTAALAAFGAGTRLLSFVFLPTLGISMSMLIMVGQNHGAGQRRRVGRITRTTLGFTLTLLSALALPVIIFPRAALSIFTNQPEVILAGEPLARFVTMARPMLSIVNVTALWFQARGLGTMGMLPNLIMRVMMEPLGLWAGLVLGGLRGGWLGMAAGGFVGGGFCLMLLIWRLRIYERSGDRPPAAPFPAQRQGNPTSGSP